MHRTGLSPRFTFLGRALVGAALATASVCAWAQAKIAVTDLTYKDQVSEYFSYEAGYAKSRESGSANYRDSDFSSSGNARRSASSESAYVKASGTLTRIEYGELRKFTADLKGQLLQSGAFRVVQGKPVTDARPTEQIFDIVARIKKGYYPGADYVLFGTVDSVEFRNDVQPVEGTNKTSLLYSLEIAVEFSLINARTGEIKAAFTAVGEGNDTKLWSGGARLTPNRARVMQEVSRSLADEAMDQIAAQFQGAPVRRTERGEDRGSRSDRGNAPPPPREAVTVYQ
ncbi:hypothetical protein PTE30175_01554 [Pandoraea terrae]|uniref:Penicillin-binding protein activator LpoB n=1 Tax=Pandoraea terrae TaxID=1537710 RepID=A0A5E4TTY1_9BURK|nr:LPS assembly lipoprotein LptE [Pandoraea terrae]VVD91061.1 hypothetical protein PTE30175_01554 [Pandoraea terrae]